ncbi:MAG: HAD family phosphatase [Lentimicrobiaceae bacterium]|nr:HAD family phosphatase [Lentimicrobiaceae bacterium]MCO5266283.1 HAD family phosphatase [Lentimicrobium sp.]HPG32638.1 HAD family phosphatase [Lentimicrobium sp.]
MKKTMINLNGIKNIIFDFGNVLLNINPLLSASAFSDLGVRDGIDFWGSRSSSDLLIGLEKGSVSPDEFRKVAMQMLVPGITPQQIDQAWNALLLDFPMKRVEKLQELRQSYRLFLLSNSNQIHYDCFMKRFESEYGFGLDQLFEKLWFSHQLGMVKPDAAIFRHVLGDADLNPSETLFIDDTLVHVEAARLEGIHAFHLSSGLDISNLL